MPFLPAQPGRRRVLRTALSLPAAALAGPAVSRPFQSGTVKLIVGFPAGGSADAVARATAAGLTKETGLPVVVENRPGGQLVISLQALTTAPPDGMTLLYMTGTYLAIQATQRLFDIDAQTTPIVNTIETPIVLVVRADSRFRSVSELVDHARSNPGKLNFGVIGLGGVEHLKMSQIQRIAGFKGLAVPYKGGPDGVNAVLGGEIDCMLVPGIFARTFAGKLRTLALLGSKRWQALPGVPTLGESGIQVPPASYWGGWSAPAGLNPKMATDLGAVLARVSQQPEVVSALNATSHELRLTESPEQFRQQIRSELSWMSEVATSEGLIAK
ncbi:MAG: hypothetical protein RIS35_1194 [Pseudomonadota bacterium]|jgi:tripartite-type tricarboxylate transporter receptor subunit TctC